MTKSAENQHGGRLPLYGRLTPAAKAVGEG